MHTAGGSVPRAFTKPPTVGLSDDLPMRLLSSQTRLLRCVAMQVLLRTRARKRGIP